MEWSKGSTIIKGILCLWSSTIVPDKPPISSLGWLMLLFLFRTVIKLNTGSLLIEQCSFIASLRPFYARKVKIIQMGTGNKIQAGLPWKGFSLQQQRLFNTWVPKVFLSGLHYLEICLYIVKASSAFWSPGKDYFLQLKDFSTLGCGSCNPASSRPEGWIHSIIRRLSSSFALEPAILLLQPRMFLSWIQNMELSIYEAKAVSMFWGPEKNSFFSPVDRLQSPILLGICHSLWLRQVFD